MWIIVGRPWGHVCGCSQPSSWRPELRHLLGSERLSGPDGAVAGDGVGGAVLPRFEAAALGHEVENVEEAPGRVALADQDRDAPEDVRAASKRLHLEPHLTDQLAVRFQQLALAVVERDRDGLHEPLYLRRAGERLGLHSLEQHPLVGGVLVDQVHAVRALRRDVRRLHLAQHSQAGQRGRGRQRRRGQDGTGTVVLMPYGLAGRRLWLRLAADRRARRPYRPERVLHGRLRRARARDRGGSQLRHRRVGRQRLPDRLLQRGEHGALVPEADLRLARMHVDVDVAVRQGDLHDRDRVPALRKEPVVRLLQRVAEHPVLDPTAVDEDRDLAAVGP